MAPWTPCPSFLGPIGHTWNHQGASVEFQLMAASLHFWVLVSNLANLSLLQHIVCLQDGCSSGSQHHLQNKGLAKCASRAAALMQSSQIYQDGFWDPLQS